MSPLGCSRALYRIKCHFRKDCAAQSALEACCSVHVVSSLALRRQPVLPRIEEERSRSCLANVIGLQFLQLNGNRSVGTHFETIPLANLNDFLAVEKGAKLEALRVTGPRVLEERF